MFRPFVLLLGVLTVFTSLQARERTSELWGRDGELWSPTSRLPDFSFAGYRFGEVPIPDVSVKANVTDFGARGDDEEDDTEAFKQAIAATDSGAILIPPGRYVITDILRIEKPNLVLRGAGSDRTTLYCPKPLEHIASNMGATTQGRPTSHYSWSGGILWVRGTRETRAPRAVIAAAVRGDTRLMLASIDGLRVGDRVHLAITDDAEHALIDHLFQGDPGEIDQLVAGRPVKTAFVSRIAGIDERGITLERTLPFDVRPGWKPELGVFDPDVREVGIEGVRIEFPVTPYEGHFTEPGYNGIAIDNASDCWVRDIHLHNADSGVFLNGTFCTLDGMVLTSDRPPHPARQATGHHALLLGVDCLVQRFDFRTHFIHDIAVSAGDTRNVIKNGRGVNLSFDHHKRAPYGNLFCDIDVGEGAEIWRSGGGAGLGKHTAAWGTFWNIRSSRPLSPPDERFGPPLLNFVGLATDEPSVLEPAGRWWEAIPPEALYPQDLHAAQLARRLASASQERGSR